MPLSQEAKQTSRGMRPGVKKGIRPASRRVATSCKARRKARLASCPVCTISFDRADEKTPSSGADAFSAVAKAISIPGTLLSGTRPLSSSPPDPLDPETGNVLRQASDTTNSASPASPKGPQ